MNEGFVFFAGADEEEAVGDLGGAVGDGGDDVGAAEPVGFGEVGGGPLGGVVGVGVVEADDVEAELAAFALGGDELLRRDVVAVVGAVGAGVTGTEEVGDGEVLLVGVAEEDAAALVRVGLFAVGAEGVVEGAGVVKGLGEVRRCKF